MSEYVKIIYRRHNVRLFRKYVLDSFLDIGCFWYNDNDKEDFKKLTKHIREINALGS